MNTSFWVLVGENATLVTTTKNKMLCDYPSPPQSAALCVTQAIDEVLSVNTGRMANDVFFSKDGNLN